MGNTYKNIVCFELGQHLCPECGAICHEPAPPGLCPECKEKKIAEYSRIHEIIMGEEYQEGDSEPTAQEKIFDGIIRVIIEEGLADSLCEVIKAQEQSYLQARAQWLMTFQEVCNSMGVDNNEDYRMLREMGILDENNVPYNEYFEKGYFVVV